MVISKLRDMPLRYRLIIPFFFLALMGTLVFVGLALLSHRAVISHEERERLYGYGRALDHNRDLQGRWAVSVASSFARNPEVASALADRDRLRLLELAYPSYVFMKNTYGISQFNFHTPEPRMFLRLHRLYEYGDDLRYRETILATVFLQRETYGLETGLTGHGIRGVAPVFHEGRLVGTVEVGFNFGAIFLEELQKQFGIEASLLEPDETGERFKSFATTFYTPVVRDDPAYRKVFEDRTPVIVNRMIDGTPYAVLIRTVEDYRGKRLALVELLVERSQTLAVINYYRNLMLTVGFIGMLLSIGAIYLISAYFTRPIGEMVTFAQQISKEEQVTPLTRSPGGELRVLAEALEEMLVSLYKSRLKIQEYTENLEEMVHARTRALRESEEKHRTLVENVPLVVYRLLGDGQTIFINYYVEEVLGVSFRDVLSNPHFWKEKVWMEDRPRVWPLMDRCLQGGDEFKAEYRIQDTTGKFVFVMDRAIPVLDEKGNVETVDGYFMDVTDRHCLQKQIIQTEELRTLNEISARLAHEIRNPLVAAGGFARRLLNGLSEEDPNREKVRIIVQEVARLEKILEKTIAYLKPFEILLERHSVNDLVAGNLEELKDLFEENQVVPHTNLAGGVPLVLLDPVLFKSALENMLQGMLFLCQPQSKLQVRSYTGENTVHLEVLIRGTSVSDDDLEHFFYPFTAQSDRTKKLDLPLAKMIIHKHQGLVRFRRSDKDQLVLDITLPQ